MAEKKVINGYQSQIASINQENKEFEKNTNLFDIIAEEFEEGKNYIVRRIGIQTTPGIKVLLNSIPIVIGKTGIYEVDDVEITSIVLEENNDDMIIDYIIKEV